MAKLNVGEKLALLELDATKLLISVIVTFLLWFVLAIVLLVLFHLRSSQMTGYLLSLQKVFSFLGLSVLSLTALTWKINLYLLLKFYKWYTGKYENNS